MILNELFEATSSDWVKYTKYETIEHGGRKWITPAADSRVIVYSPVQMSENIVVDALNFGRLLCMENVPKDYSNPVNDGLMEAVTATYGLLGIKMDEPTDFFKPFKKKENRKTAYSMPIIEQTGRDLKYEMVFSHDYAEPIDEMLECFKALYIHFSACQSAANAENPAIKRVVDETISKFTVQNVGFQMRMTNKPTMVWEFGSLKTMIETIYAVAVSRENPMLRMCKHCGKAFYAHHGRSEFCEDKCRNQFNVYKHRKMKKRDGR
ncbi:MAG: hypothetical protein FWE04_03210 [Oscillospiraceae bacterium]|nr:hypothetical protein [Oscillospiraceae bacterium]